MEDGINAARVMMPRVWIDERKCAPLIEALLQYRWEYNQRLGEFKSRPLHDWTSHAADAWRYLAVGHRDPYEDEEREPKEGKGLLWFGFAGNYFDLKPLLPDLLKYELNLVSNHNWSLELLDKYLRECRCVIIPTGRSMAKSANRAIKAIRYGKYPVCGYLPAHEELGLGGEPIIEHLDYAMTNDMSGRIRELQEQIEARFHPETVAKQWYRAIHEAQSLQRRKAVP